MKRAEGGLLLGVRFFIFIFIFFPKLTWTQHTHFRHSSLMYFTNRSCFFFQPIKVIYLLYLSVHMRCSWICSFATVTWILSRPCDSSDCVIFVQYIFVLRLEHVSLHLKAQLKKIVEIYWKKNIKTVKLTIKVMTGLETSVTLANYMLCCILFSIWPTRTCMSSIIGPIIEKVFSF